MRRENGMTDPPPKRNSLCLSVFDQLAKSSKWINLKTKNRPQQRAVRKHRKHPWCEKESMPHLDSIDGAKKTTICSVLRVIWNWSEWDRLWGHQGIATIYSRRIIWVFWWGGAVASGGMWVSQDRGSRGLPLWLGLLFEVNFVFRASYTKKMQLTIYQSLVCLLCQKL